MSDPLARLYESMCADTNSDIYAHLPTIMDHASVCADIAEIGCRWGFTTAALLMGNPRKLISLDCDINAIVFCASKFCENIGTAEAPRSMCGRTLYQPRCGNSLEVELEEVDLLLIDSLHTYSQLKVELSRHGNKARKFLIFHDTETFGEVSEDGTKPGLKAAIREFQLTHMEWSCVRQDRHNNGLVVLQKLPFLAAGLSPPLAFFRPDETLNPPREIPA